VDLSSIAEGLWLAEDGIWYSAERREVSYPASGAQTCFSVEDGSFWFRHRNNCIVAAVGAFPPLRNGPVFDIGAGNGFVSLGLTGAGFRVALVEPNPTGALNACSRGLAPVICSTFEDAKFKPGSIPAIGLFDVIEHVSDDLGFMRSAWSALMDGGRVYVTVPAHQMLWSDADERAGHFRRYSLRRVRELLSSYGFQVEYSTYFFRFLPFGIFLARTIPYRLGLSGSHRSSSDVSREHGVGGDPVARVLSSLHEGEVELVRRGTRIPFGGSCLVVARKA
jgi:SAM-dependent methyltransferase